MFFDKVYYDDKNNPIEINIICNKCGKIISINDISKFQIIKNDYCIIKENNSIVCDECGNIGNGIIQYKNNPNIKDIIINKPKTQSTKPHCPTCNSTNIQKISGTERFVTTGLFGLASSNVGKTMHCKNCGYKW